MAHILIVDDELAIGELLCDILSGEGHRVELAQDAVQARAAQRRACPDLVLLDLSLPGTNGLALLKEWSDLALLASMPVIMMSGHDGVNVAVQARRLGARGLLAKPIALNTLLKAVAQGLPGIAAPPPAAPEGVPLCSAQAQDPRREYAASFWRKHCRLHILNSNSPISGFTCKINAAA